jgi:hypothetical protein
VAHGHTLVGTGAKVLFSSDNLGLVIWHIKPQALEALKVVLAPGIWPDSYAIGRVEKLSVHSGHCKAMWFIRVQNNGKVPFNLGSQSLGPNPNQYPRSVLMQEKTTQHSMPAG